VDEEDGMYQFHFENNEGKKMDLSTSVDPSLSSKKIKRDHYDFKIVYKRNKKNNLSGNLFIQFSDGSKPMEIKFYNLTIGRLSAIQFLHLPVKITSKEAGTGNEETTDIEIITYDDRARVSSLTYKSKFITNPIAFGTPGTRTEKVTWSENGKIKNIELTYNTKTPEGEERSFTINSVPTFDSNGRVEKTVEKFKDKLFSESELRHNSKSGALEFQEAKKYGRKEDLREISTTKVKNDVDNNSIREDSVIKNLAFNFTDTSKLEHKYEVRKNYASDIGKTTPNRNLLSFNEEYFGPKNRIETKHTFPNPEPNGGEVIDINSSKFTYNIFGYPVKAITSYSQVTKANPNGKPISNGERIYEYQFAIIVK